MAENSFFVVLNPTAGNSDPDSVLRVLEDSVGSGGGRYEVYLTTGEEVVGDVVRQAIKEGYRTIVAAGGDGTVSAVADVLAGTEVRLGILPVGTGNLLARDLLIPLELSEAAALLVNPGAATRFIDSMRVNGQTFISHISLGVYSQIIRQTTPEQKRRFGRMAYVWAAVKEITNYPTWTFEVAVDGRKLLYRASMAIVANVASVGIPPLEWGPNIAPDDGRIEVCIIKANTAGDYFQLLWQALQNQLEFDRQYIEYLSAGRKISLRANRPVPIRADGEIIGESSVSIQVDPGSLQVIAPSPTPKKAAHLGK